MKSIKRGGIRKGAGRKSRYNEPTKTVSFRVPVSKITEITKIIINKLITYEGNNNK